MVPENSWARWGTTPTRWRSWERGELPHVPAVHQHGALGGVVKAGNQVHQGGLAAAGAPDDAHGVPGLYGKVQPEREASPAPW